MCKIVKVFNDGLKIVSDNDKEGVLDSKNNVLIPCVYENIHRDKIMFLAFDEEDNLFTYRLTDELTKDDKANNKDFDECVRKINKIKVELKKLRTKEKKLLDSMSSRCLFLESKKIIKK